MIKRTMYVPITGQTIDLLQLLIQLNDLSFVYDRERLVYES